MAHLLTHLAKRHELAMFFLLAYAISWSIAFPLMIFHWPIQVSIAVTFGPCLAALIVHRLSTGNYRAFAIFRPFPRSVTAGVIGMVLVVLAFVVLPAVLTADPRKLVWRILMSTSVYSYSTFLAGPLGEEFGWRGYALPRLEARMGPMWGTLSLAVLWAFWHLPFFLIPGWTTAPPWIYVLIVTGLGFIFTFTANLARFAVIAAFLVHAMFNTAARFLNGMFAHVQPSAPIPFELVMGLCGLGVAAILVAATKGTLAYPGPGSGEIPDK